MSSVSAAGRADRCSASAEVTKSGNGMVRTLAVVFGGARHGARPGIRLITPTVVEDRACVAGRQSERRSGHGCIHLGKTTASSLALPSRLRVFSQSVAKSENLSYDYKTGPSRAQQHQRRGCDHRPGLRRRQTMRPHPRLVSVVSQAIARVKRSQLPTLAVLVAEHRPSAESATQCATRCLVPIARDAPERALRSAR